MSTASGRQAYQTLFIPPLALCPPFTNPGSATIDTFRSIRYNPALKKSSILIFTLSNELVFILCFCNRLTGRSGGEDEAGGAGGLADCPPESKLLFSPRTQVLLYKLCLNILQSASQGRSL